MLTGTALFYSFVSGLFYVLATLTMKYWGGFSLFVVLPLAGAALCLAAIFEIEALKTGQMARTFIVILSFEFLFTFVCAIFLLHEQYSLRDTIGFVLVFAGIVLLAGKKEAAVEQAVAKEAVLQKISGQPAPPEELAAGSKVST